jgi:cytochrome P450
VRSNHPLVSSDLRNWVQAGGRPQAPTDPYEFINLDPPKHDRLRRMAMRHFGPPNRPTYLEQLRPEMLRIITKLLDQLQGQRQIDFIERFAYPLPVTMICRILGVPPEDEPRFHVWAEAVAESVATHAQRRQRQQAFTDLNEYMARLVERHRKEPGDDLLSGLATDTGPDGRMEAPYLVATASLLLVAGHETTVNLLGNAMLTLLRHPALLERLRNVPDLIPSTVEELLRYEPPAQFYRSGPRSTGFRWRGPPFPRACSSRWPWPQATVIPRGSRSRQTRWHGAWRTPVGGLHSSNLRSGVNGEPNAPEKGIRSRSGYRTDQTVAFR